MLKCGKICRLCVYILNGFSEPNKKIIIKNYIGIMNYANMLHISIFSYNIDIIWNEKREVLGKYKEHTNKLQKTLIENYINRV